MFNRTLLVSVALASPLAAAGDPLDCNDMAFVVREMLVDGMQIPRYLVVDAAEGADATFQMNYFHAERREYNRTFCKAMIRFDPTSFAEAERRSARLRPFQGLPNAAAVGRLARYANFPDGIQCSLQARADG
jgi:hypothetical protein